MELTIRTLQQNDASIIADAFYAQGWNKPVTQYEQYYAEQVLGKRVILIAFVADVFAGYITIVWKSDYPPFRDADIPEICDFNVLMAYQRRGIGSRLMDEAEQHIHERSQLAGIGVGMTADYGAAQQLYVRRGYIPDGNGLMYNHRSPSYGESVPIDDGLVLYFTKPL